MKKLIILTAVIVATGLSLPQSTKAAGAAAPPPLNPTNMFQPGCFDVGDAGDDGSGGR